MDNTEDRSYLSSTPTPVRWVILVASSLILSVFLRAIGLPASFLIGPMVCGIFLSVLGGRVKIPGLLYLGSLGLIGCMVGRVINPDLFGSMLSQWPVLLTVVLSIVIFSSLIGWILSRYQILPGTTGIWGSAPGAASVMVVMCKDHGGDPQLVAVMQYMRIVCVALVASVVAHFWVQSTGTPIAKPFWVLPPLDSFLVTIGLGFGGALLGYKLKIPTGALLLPFVLGTILHGSGVAKLDLPPWLAAIAVSVLGWQIGMGFTRSSLLHAFRALPQMLASTVLLILFCGAIAFALTKILGIDALTAYLATNPGGVDSAMIIGASANVDMSFIMLLQTSRLFVVIFIGPLLARVLAQRHLRYG